MPRGNHEKVKQRYDKEKAVKAQPVEFKGYIQVNITVQEKANYAAIEAEIDPILFIISSVQDGYKFACFWSAKEELFIASLFDQNPKSPTAGYILNVRARTPDDAIKRLCFYHEDYLQKDWGARALSPDEDTW